MIYNCRVPAGSRGDWGREIHKSMLHIETLKSWHILYTNRMRNEVDNFVPELIKVSAAMKFRVPEPKRHAVNDDRPITYMQTLDRILNEDPSFIVIVVSNNNADR